MNQDTRSETPAPAVGAQVERPVGRLEPKRCEYCDGTGDVTGFDGEWRGYCVCDAGQALKTPPPAERCKCGYAMPCGLTVPVQFCRA